METVAAYKLIGAGLAAMGAGFAAIGVGIIFGMFLQGALRNPAAADKLGGDRSSGPDRRRRRAGAGLRLMPVSAPGLVAGRRFTCHCRG
jgi:hypothetical protein